MIRAEQGRSFQLDKVDNRFRDGRRIKLFLNSGVIGLLESLEQMSNFDDKAKGPPKQQDNGGHLSQDSGSLSVEDSGFFKDFQVLFHGAVGPFGGRANFFNQVDNVLTRVGLH